MPSRGLRVPIRCTVATPPREIERRAIAILESQNIAVKILGAFEIRRFDRVVL